MDGQRTWMIASTYYLITTSAREETHLATCTTAQWSGQSGPKFLERMGFSERGFTGEPNGHCLSPIMSMYR